LTFQRLPDRVGWNKGRSGGEEKMILFPHMLVGAAIGSQVKSVGAIFVIATALHFLFDRLPHFEYLKKLNLKEITNRKLFMVFLVALLDLAAGILIIWLLLRDALISGYVLWGIFISILPDGFVFLHVLMRVAFKWEIKILKIFYSFHERIHIADENNSSLSGWVAESLIVASSVYLILVHLPIR
jgi:hypothetical protein